MTRTFKGLVYVKHGRVGSRSEGPDYYLQTTIGDFLLHMGQRMLWQPDYHLEFYGRRMVEIQGVLQAPRLIEVQSITEIVASMLPPMHDESLPRLGEPCTLKVGASVTFENGPSLGFVTVTEDSRCPPGAMCIWAGRATVALRLDVAGSQSSNFALTLQPGCPELAETTLTGYRVTLQHLEPPSHPASGDDQYAATLVVSAVPPSHTPA